MTIPKLVGRTRRSAFSVVALTRDRRLYQAVVLRWPYGILKLLPCAVYRTDKDGGFTLVLRDAIGPLQRGLMVRPAYVPVVMMDPFFSFVAFARSFEKRFPRLRRSREPSPD